MVQLPELSDKKSEAYKQDIKLLLKYPKNGFGMEIQEEVEAEHAKHRGD